MVIRWGADDGPILDAVFVIFQGICTSIANKKHYIFVIFYWGPDPLPPPSPPPLWIHAWSEKGFKII